MSKRKNKPTTDSRAPAPPKGLVSARDLHKTYRMGAVSLEVLRGVSFDVQAGEFITIYGHSGSGKSTLLHLLGLLDEPTNGSVFLEQDDTSTFSRRRRNAIRNRDVGFVFQFYYLLPELSVLENTLLPAMVEHSTLAWRGKKKELRRRAEEILVELGLGDRMKHRPKELSGGERQRTAIARALVNQPKLLLADEPTGNLDSKTGQKIIDVLVRLNREHKQTILMVTHDEELAHQLGRSLYLKDGRLAKT
ncbi:MAG: ABC transporter ATP-binding protein [Phycisphaerae bacterium]|nr:ABC transporter ATP-binding protein [Phycisphaerae bacterium]